MDRDGAVRVLLADAVESDHRFGGSVGPWPLPRYARCDVRSRCFAADIEPMVVLAVGHRSPRRIRAATTAAPRADRRGRLSACSSRSRWPCAPSGAADAPVLAVTGILYTIPSLALFALLLPVTGLKRTTVLIRRRLHAAHPRAQHGDRARGGAARRARGRDRHGLRRERRLLASRAAAGAAGHHRRRADRRPSRRSRWSPWRRRRARRAGPVHLPTASSDIFRTPITVGVVLSLLLAVVADLLLLGALTLATPWRRAERRSR